MHFRDAVEDVCASSRRMGDIAYEFVQGQISPCVCFTLQYRHVSLAGKEVFPAHRLVPVLVTTRWYSRHHALRQLNGHDFHGTQTMLQQRGSGNHDQSVLLVSSQLQTASKCRCCPIRGKPSCPKPAVLFAVNSGLFSNLLIW